MSRSPTRRRGGRVKWATFLLLALSAVMVLVFLVCAGGLVVLVSLPSSPKVVDGSWLRITLDGAIGDAPASGGFVFDPDQAPATVTELTEAIRRAKDDSRIQGVYLEFDGPGFGWGLRREVRSALVELREAGKPCVTYGEVYEMGDYYLASACDRVVASPGGVLFVAGMSQTVTYYKGGMEKLGITADFVHVGDYKTAVEPFERDGPSEAAVVSYEALYDSLYGTIAAEIAASRSKTVEEVQAWIDLPTLDPGKALERGTIDAVAYRDAVRARLAGVADATWAASLAAPVTKEEKGTKFTRFSEYRRDVRAVDRSKDKRIAVIQAEGTILSGDGGGMFGGAGLFDKPYAKWMKSAREDDRIVAVVLRVNSPGGSALAADNMWHEAELTKAAGKPVVVSMGDYAASGGYMMSCNADWIVAQPTTITGSIGVFGQFFKLQGTYEMLGLTQHTYQRGRNADMLSMTQPFTPEARGVLQEWVGETYTDFVGQVATGRNKPVDTIEAVAQGRVWTGSQALQNGLVDELGGLEVAIAKASQLASVQDAGIVRFPQQKTFFEALFEELDEPQATTPEVQVALPLPDAAQDLLDELRTLRAIEDAGGLMAYDVTVKHLR